MLRETFLVQFPEFAQADTDLIDATLAAAALEIDPLVWNGLADQGQAYLAAHKLACSPFGQNARMSTKDGVTTYEKHFKSLVRKVASGFRVTA